MDIAIVGLSHKTASVEVREKLSFPEPVLPDALCCLARVEPVNENIILSTCNRVEAYVTVSEHEGGVERVKRFFLDYHKLDGEAYFKRLCATSSGSPRASTRWSWASRRYSGSSRTPSTTPSRTRPPAP